MPRNSGTDDAHRIIALAEQNGLLRGAAFQEEIEFQNGGGAKRLDRQWRRFPANRQFIHCDRPPQGRNRVFVLEFTVVLKRTPPSF
jgi:hypothetical protein